MARRRAPGGAGGWHTYHPPAAPGGSATGTTYCRSSSAWARIRIRAVFARSRGFKSQTSLDVENIITVSLRDICGRQKTIRLDDGKTVDFNLPAGVLAGDRIN